AGLAGFTDLASPGTITCSSCGERGIRTPDTFRYTRFPVVHLRPLGHLSREPLAEREGFEPPVPLQVRLISNQVHSTTLPSLLSCMKNVLRSAAHSSARTPPTTGIV